MQIDIQLQEQFLGFLGKARYKVAKSGRGSGKSFSAVDALIILALQYTLKILCCRQFQNSISDSSYALLEERIEAHGLEAYFTIYRDKIVCNQTGTLFLFKGLERNIASVKSIPNVSICFVEEAEAIKQESWDTLLPTLREDGTEIWVNFNPQLPTDPTAKLFLGENPPPNMILMSANYDENRYLSPAMLREIEHMRKTDYQRYLHVYRGEFMDTGEQKMYPLALVQDAINRPTLDNGAEEIVGALDVARFGSDRSVLRLKQGSKILDKVQWVKQSIPDLCRMVVEEVYKKEITTLIVDSAGVGGGAYDLLVEMIDSFCEVLEFNGSYKADDAHYANARAETYARAKDFLREGSIPSDAPLIKELLTIEYKFNKKNQLQIEDKAEMKKRLGSSPDEADAFTMLFYSKSRMNRRKMYEHYGVSGKRGMYDRPRRAWRA